ncbi:Protein bric-a-brac 1 [Nymphon striatum]|nr:Protein bric-a-brac 1 [Nymphon striatum]
MGSQQYCLRWNNHQTNFLTVFDRLLSNGSFADVTLALVLSACSPYFEEMLVENPDKHPIVILRDFKMMDLKAIIEFMYKGEVSVCKDQLGTLIKTAEALKIKGLAEITNEQTQKVVQPTNSVHFSGGKIQLTRNDEDEHPESTSPPRKQRKRKNSSENGNHDGDEPVDMTNETRSEVTFSPKSTTMTLKPKDKLILQKYSSSMRNNNSEVSFMNSHTPLKIHPGQLLKHIKSSPPSSPVVDNSELSEYPIDRRVTPIWSPLSIDMLHPGHSTAYNHPASGLSLLDTLKSEYPQEQTGIVFINSMLDLCSRNFYLYCDFFFQTEIRPENLIRGRGRAPNWTQEDMRSALQAVMSGYGSKKTARLYNIPWSTLKRYIRRTRTQTEASFPGLTPLQNVGSPINTSQTELPVENVNLFKDNENNNNADSPSTNNDMDDTSNNSSPVTDLSICEPPDKAPMNDGEEVTTAVN